MNQIQVIRGVVYNFIEELQELMKDKEKNPYGAIALSGVPRNAYLPHLQVKLENYQLISENTDKTDQSFRMTIVVDVYAEKKDGVSGRDIVEQLEAVLFDYFFNEYGFKIDFSTPIVNLDQNVHRQRMRFSGKIDLGRLSIYRR